MTAMDTIRIVSTSVYTGPGCWTTQPAVRFSIDASAAEPDGLDRLMVLMNPQGDGLADTKGDTPTLWRSMGSLIAGIASQMHQDVSRTADAEFAFAGEAPGTFDVIIETREPRLARACVETTVRMLNMMLFGTEPGVSFQEILDSEVKRVAWSAATWLQEEAVFQAAKRRGIPFRLLIARSHYIELGTGIYLRRYRGMTTSSTSILSCGIAVNKSLTNRLLSEVGLPVPQGKTVSQVESAIAFAEELGYPVVTKPIDGGKGNGVSVNLQNKEEVRAGFEAAFKATRKGKVIVEQHIRGSEHRVLVMEDQVAAVAWREAAHVIGDGVHSIAELIEIANADPIRADARSTSLFIIKADSSMVEILGQQGKTLASVPERRERVALRLVSNISLGGLVHDRTDDIHPENARLAVLAAKTIGLDICGIDMVVEDIGKPIWDQQGAIIEVNSHPGPLIHLNPQYGQHRDLGESVLDSLYPPGTPGRVPVVAVLGERSAPSIATQTARIVEQTGKIVGLTTTATNTIDGRPMRRPDLPGRTHPDLVLRNSDVEFAVIQVEPIDFEPPGLGFDRCDLIVLVDAVAQPRGARTCEEVLFDLVGPNGCAVIDADHPGFEALRPLLPRGSVVFSADPGHVVIGEWLAGGGAGVTVQDNAIVWRHCSQETVVAPDIGTVSKEVLAGVAAAMALELPIDAVQVVRDQPHLG